MRTIAPSLAELLHDAKLLADLYREALVLIRKVVDRARAGNQKVEHLLSDIEDVLDVVADGRVDPQLIAHAHADLKKFDEVLSRDDATADGVLRDKFSGVNNS